MPSETIRTPATGSGQGTVIVDLGKKSKKAIKRLRKGEGKLMDEVNQCIKDLRESNKISGSAQPVVIVVREKMDSLKDVMGMMNMKW